VAGSLPCTELLKAYGLEGPLEDDKLLRLREERQEILVTLEVSFEKVTILIKFDACLIVIDG
jgi:hypothetical protein